MFQSESHKSRIDEFDSNEIKTFVQGKDIPDKGNTGVEDLEKHFECQKLMTRITWVRK